MLEIRRYTSADEEQLMRMLEAEGEDWSCYTAPEMSAKYRLALHDSLTYIACDGDTICGFARALDDCGFYIYLCDLLVKSAYRGLGLGKKLAAAFCRDYPDQIVYVMSDADDYYLKQGYCREGSVFLVPMETEDQS